MILYSGKDLNRLRESGKILRETKELLKKNIKPGTSLLELNKIAHEYIINKNAIPSFLNYNGFQGSICTSVNDILLHGVPNNYILKDGDIITVDIGVFYKGFHTDSAFTKGIGNISEEDKILLKTTRECLTEALAIIKEGTKLGSIGKVIETIAKKKGFYLTEDFAGHGVGKNLHEDPYIFNVEESPFKNVQLKEGMVIAIEPMLLIGTKKLFVDPIDNWSIRTINGKNTAHDEHTILVLKDGIEILT